VGLALFLACLGFARCPSHLAARGTNEIGVPMAVSGDVLETISDDAIESFRDQGKSAAPVKVRQPAKVLRFKYEVVDIRRVTLRQRTVV